jgi:hypothetical protein
VEELPVIPIEVEFEEIDGVRKIKKLETGEHPIDAMGAILVELDRKYRAEHNGWPIFEISTVKAKGEYGESDHYETTVYSLQTGKRVPISKIIAIDKDTGKPATIVSKDGIYTPKAEGVFNLEQLLTHDRLKEEAIKRGLQLRTETIKQLDKVKEDIEG